MSEPFAHTSGPRQARIVAVGEAWGEQEEAYGRPFVGSSGQEFWRMLGEAWPKVAPEKHALARSAFPQYRDGGLGPWVSLREDWLEAAGLMLTNVFALRPKDNNLEALCATKAEVGKDYSLPALVRGKYLRPEYFPEVERFYRELEDVRPNLVLALGNTAIWALLGATNIGSLRGSVARANKPAGLKVLPTYHPAGVMRNWSWRPIVIVDLMKALREAQFPELRRPRRQVLINPTLGELRSWKQTEADYASIISVDIETHARQISCVGFATRRDYAVVIPFASDGCLSRSYWPSVSDELAAWDVVKAVLEGPAQKLFQNGLFDIQYFARMGFRVKNATQDTMLLHHSLFPEMQKGLGFLGSVYTDEAAWKLMRRQKQDAEKRDE